MHQALEHSNDGQKPLPAWGLNFRKLWARRPGVGGNTMQKLGEHSLLGRGMGVWTSSVPLMHGRKGPCGLTANVKTQHSLGIKGHSKVPKRIFGGGERIPPKVWVPKHSCVKQWGTEARQSTWSLVLCTNMKSLHRCASGTNGPTRSTPWQICGCAVTRPWIPLSKKVTNINS